jgi:hypothetical protein
MSTSLAAFHHVYDNLLATEEAVKSFRSFYPHSPYFLLGDDGKDHYEICKKYNCSFFNFNTHLGYPPFNQHGIIEWLSRVFLACAKSNTSHIMLMEDDVHIINKVEYSSDWELAGYPSSWNEPIHSVILEKITQHTNKRPLQAWYGGGGGSILKVKTFLENYYKFIDFYYNNFDYFLNFQQIIGWTDFTLTCFYFFSGKDYTVNPRLYEIKDSFNEPELIKNYDILHHYKKYYTIQ